MTRTKLLLVVCFLAAFGAGGAAALVLKKEVAPERPRNRASWLGEQLKLSPQQKDQMGQIWSGVDANSRGYFDQRRTMADDRDKAIAALMTAEQKPKYEQILQDYDRKTADLSAQRKAAFDQAVEKTKQILTDEQKQQYDEILKRERDRGPSGGPGRHGGPPGRDGGPPPGMGGRRGGPPEGPAPEKPLEESNAPRVGE